MKFGGFKIGKSNEGKGKENAISGGGAATQIAELEEQLNGRTDNLKQTEVKLKNLSNINKNGKDSDAVPVLPHGPIGELTLEPEVDLAGLTAVVDEETDTTPEVSTDTIKLVEVKVEPGAPAVVKKVADIPPPAPAKEVKPDPSGDSLNSLFSHDEEEEDLLASLVKSLPDVTASELLDDINEIKGIIEDWQKK